MALVATEALQLSAFVKHAYPYKNFTRDVVTVTVAQDEVLRIGEPLGKITASGKYIKSVETAVDGSQTFGGIIADLQDGSRERTYTTAGDIQLPVILRGPVILNRTAIETLLDATYDNQTKLDTYFASVSADSGIIFATSEENFGTQ